MSTYLFPLLVIICCLQCWVSGESSAAATTSAGTPVVAAPVVPMGHHNHHSHSHKSNTTTSPHPPITIPTSTSSHHTVKLVRIPQPSKKHRAYYQWNHTLSAFQQIYYPLPDTASYLTPNFLTTSKPKQSMTPADDTSQGQLPVILDIFANKSNGYFVDLAANDYSIGSNTVCLEKYFNWTGICIEPNAIYLQNIVSHRKCTLIASPVYHENDVMIKFHLNDGLGGIVEEGMDNEKAKKDIVELPTVTMNSILDLFAPTPQLHKTQEQLGKVRIIDYLSLDVEGAEYDAIASLDFTRTIFLVISVERPKDILHEVLIRHGYWFLTHAWRQEPFGEMFYIHHSIPRFEELMKKYRASSNLRYSHNYKWHNPTFLLHPEWPLKPGVALSGNEFLHDDDIVKCGEHSRQLYLYKGKKLHAIPSLVVFYKIGGNGEKQRDMSEAIVLSFKFCAKLVEGKDLDETNVVLPASDPFWSEPKSK